MLVFQRTRASTIGAFIISNTCSHAAMELRPQYYMVDTEALNFCYTMTLGLCTYLVDLFTLPRGSGYLPIKESGPKIHDRYRLGVAPRSS